MEEYVQIQGLRLLKLKFIVWSGWGEKHPRKWDDMHFTFYDIFCAGLVMAPLIIISLIIGFFLAGVIS